MIPPGGSRWSREARAVADSRSIAKQGGSADRRHRGLTSRALGATPRSAPSCWRRSSGSVVLKTPPARTTSTGSPGQMEPSDQGIGHDRQLVGESVDERSSHGVACQPPHETRLGQARCVGSCRQSLLVHAEHDGLWRSAAEMMRRLRVPRLVRGPRPSRARMAAARASSPRPPPPPQSPDRSPMPAKRSDPDRWARWRPR